MSFLDKYYSQRNFKILLLLWVLVVASLLIGLVFDELLEDEEDLPFTEDFGVDEITFTNVGNNSYFFLDPGYQLILEGEEDGEQVRLEILVLNETEMVGNVETRVVTETEYVNGDLYEVSHNYFAMDVTTKNVFYFGETTDIYENNVSVSHEGAWRADEPGNKAGIIMPSTMLLGARYQQETAPGVAMDRATIVSIDETLTTPAGTFTNVIKFLEENPIDGDSEYKYYVKDVGLVQDEFLLLISFGYSST